MCSGYKAENGLHKSLIVQITVSFWKVQPNCIAKYPLVAVNCNIQLPLLSRNVGNPLMVVPYYEIAICCVIIIVIIKRQFIRRSNMARVTTSINVVSG